MRRQLLLAMLAAGISALGIGCAVQQTQRTTQGDRRIHDPQTDAEQAFRLHDYRFLGTEMGGGLFIPITHGDIAGNYNTHDEARLVRVIESQRDDVETAENTKKWDEAVRYAEAYNDRLRHLMVTLPQGLSWVPDAPVP